MIFEILNSANIEVKAVFDDDQRIENFEGLTVLHAYNREYLRNDQLIIAIGSNEARKKIASIIKHKSGQVLDPTSFIASSATIGPGTMILAKSIIQSGCGIGSHVIINSGAIVEHDAEIEGYCHLGPGSVVCGGVMVGEGTLIGANATVLPGVHIGAWSIIGAGAVVVHDVPSGATVVGNPAKSLE